MVKTKVLQKQRDEPPCAEAKVVISRVFSRCPSPDSYSTESKTKAWVASELSEVRGQVRAKLILELSSPVCPSGCRCHSHK